jgi:hypothetical protein
VYVRVCERRELFHTHIFEQLHFFVTDASEATAPVCQLNLTKGFDYTTSIFYDLSTATGGSLTGTDPPLPKARVGEVCYYLLFLS